jgi:hypothetical protein
MFCGNYDIRPIFDDPVYHNHHDSIEALKSAALAKCFICNTLWRKVLWKFSGNSNLRDGSDANSNFARYAVIEYGPSLAVMVGAFVSDEARGREYILTHFILDSLEGKGPSIW